MSNSNHYRNIFKSTFLFAFVQVVKVICSILKNKIAAICIGPEGFGLLGIFDSTLRMIQTGSNLGMPQSSIRDISESYSKNDFIYFSKTISVVKRLFFILGIVGLLITILLSKHLSITSFGNTSYVFSFCLLGLSVFFNILSEGNFSILKGTRNIKDLANSTIFSTILVLLLTIPLYFFYGEKGVVPVIVITSLIFYISSTFYVQKVKYQKHRLHYSVFIQSSKPMLKVGISLMFVNFIQTFVAYILNNFISVNGSLNDVGYYSAGNAILTSYFGLIVTAISTDYYPRIAAIKDNDDQLEDELNKQSIVSLLLCSPMFVIFMVYMPLFINFLYSSEFIPIIEYAKYAIFWSLITLCSNQVDMILIVKANTKAFLLISVIIRVFQLFISCLMYKHIGISGLGMGYAMVGILHMALMYLIVSHRYHITFKISFIKLFSIVLFFAILSLLITNIENVLLRYFLGSILVLISVLFSLTNAEKILDFKLSEYLLTHFFKK